MILTANDVQRFINRIDKTETCWNWKGASNGSGYGEFHFQNQSKRAHRVSYEYFNDKKIPWGMVVDHLCFNRKCVNPSHLEVITSGENALRGDGIGAKGFRQTHCKRGHPFSRENTWIRTARNMRKWRKCLSCARATQTAYRERQRAKLVV
jgi:hypothetical protein